MAGAVYLLSACGVAWVWPCVCKCLYASGSATRRSQTRIIGSPCERGVVSVLIGKYGELLHGLVYLLANGCDNRFVFGLREYAVYHFNHFTHHIFFYTA